MRNVISSLAAVVGLTLAGQAFAADEQWKDGMMFAEDELARLQGHTAFKIVFGLEPGKCAGEFTAPDEWLKMTEGTITFSYPGKDDVVRTAGDKWMATAGTKVTLCNKGDQAAVLVGVQVREN